MYTSEYPIINVAADIVVYCEGKILLVKRKNDPYKDYWSFPGGFVNANETLLAAAKRELKEETNIDCDDHLIDTIQFIGMADKVDRDPRGRTISAVYLVHLWDFPLVKAGDDAGEAEWFDTDDMPELAFDHQEIFEELFSD